MVPPLNLNNQQFAQGQAAAQQIKSAPAPAGPAALQQQGAARSAATQAAQTQQAVQQAGKQVIQAQTQQQEQRTMSSIQAKKELGDQKRKLENIAMELGNNMMQERRDFSKKKKTTAFNNERQLADWTIANSKTEIEFQSRMREISQASQRKIQTMEFINKRLKIAEDQLATATMNKETRAMKVKISRAKAALQEKLRREQEKARKKGGAFKKLLGGALFVGGVAAAPFTGGASLAVAGTGAGMYAAGENESQ